MSETENERHARNVRVWQAQAMAKACDQLERAHGRMQRIASQTDDPRILAGIKASLRRDGVRATGDRGERAWIARCEGPARRERDTGAAAAPKMRANVSGRSRAGDRARKAGDAVIAKYIADERVRSILVRHGASFHSAKARKGARNLLLTLVREGSIEIRHALGSNWCG